MFKQNLKVIGKIMGVEVTERTNAKGVEQVSCKVKFQMLPSKTMIFVENLSNKATMPSFVEGNIEQYLAMQDRLKEKEDIYGYLNIYPSKKSKETIQYNYVEHQTSSKDGSLWLKAKGFVQELEQEVIDDETFVVVKGFKGDYRVSVNDVEESYLTAVMLVESFDDEYIYLTNGAEQYPVNLRINKTTPNNPTVGQGYTFVLKFTKGEKVEVAPVEEISFDSETLKTKFLFMPDKIEIIDVATCRGYEDNKLKGKTSKANDMASMFMD